MRVMSLDGEPWCCCPFAAMYYFVTVIWGDRVRLVWPRGSGRAKNCVLGRSLVFVLTRSQVVERSLPLYVLWCMAITCWGESELKCSTKHRTQN